MALLNPNFFDEVFFFDAQYNKWTYQLTAEKFKNTFITRILSKLFYNPSFDAKVIWTLYDTYELDDLKAQITKCIDQDDDILTQFTEAEIINSGIKSSSSFDNLIKLLNEYIFTYRDEDKTN